MGGGYGPLPGGDEGERMKRKKVIARLEEIQASLEMGAEMAEMQKSDLTRGIAIGYRTAAEIVGLDIDELRAMK